MTQSRPATARSFQFNNNIVEVVGSSSRMTPQTPHNSTAYKDPRHPYSDALGLDAEIKKISQTQKLLSNIKPGMMVDNDDEDDDESLNDDTNLSSFMDEDEDDSGFLYPTHDYGAWIDSAVEEVPSPDQTFPTPPIHDEAAMKDYLKLKDIWELQLDIKRGRLGEFVSKNCMQPGIHKADSYNPKDYSNLKVSPAVSQLFNYIRPSALSPDVQEVKLAPFIPDFYPSVGDIDAFIKVCEPTIDDDGVGLKALDEPSTNQSDPSLLDLQLRALAKMKSVKAVMVKSLENASEHPDLVEKWVKDITQLHRSKPSPSVHYSKQMPDIETLLQEWSPEEEEIIKQMKIPEPDISCSLENYVDIVCNMLDIPVYNENKVHSLHVLFSLYAAAQEFNEVVGVDVLNLREQQFETRDSRQQEFDQDMDALKLN
ncbi:uncharacterized protein LOC118434738 [Folsomia candida]|nr:uncharacterized protein LOC118434738 [Folsomia candida]